MSKTLGPAELALKEDSKKLVRAAGGVEAAAEYARPGKTLMGEYGSPHVDTFMPVDVVGDLETVTRGTAGWPIVTRRLASRQGCALVALPAPGAIEVDWIESLGTLSCESSGVAQGICKALHGDRIVTADEVRGLKLIDECDRLIQAVVTIRARLERIAENGTQ